MLEIFKTLEQYISIPEKLMIKSLDYGSPGGMKYTALPPIPSRSENESKPNEEKSPLKRTQEIIEHLNDDAKDKKTISTEDILRETIIQYRAIDPEIIQIIKNALDVPLRNLKQMINSNKIQDPRMTQQDKDLRRYGATVSR